LAAAPETLTQNVKLLAWVSDMVELCKPDSVHMCEGTKAEYKTMCDLLVENGTFTKLNENLRPDCFLARSHPSDVARVEDRTYICTEDQAEAGPTNNWAAPGEMKQKMRNMFAGCMAGRTMYVIPFSMGPVGSPFSKIGVEITDSAYVVVNMSIMTRVGTKVLEALGEDGEYIPCLHSVGAPLAPSQEDVAWPCERDPLNKYIVHLVVWLWIRG
jgi:phosphoenolpyruvate carboxykinase (GTP)